MDLGEIIKDSLAYPINNIKSLIVYGILGIIVGIVVGSSFLGMVVSINGGKVVETLASGFIGFVVALFVGFVVSGYQLDIVKFGIDRRNDGPSFDVMRQFFNGVKVFVVSLIYYVIPLIIVAILGLFLKNWIMTIITFILFVIFALAQFMAQCRLAKTEDLGTALAIGEAIGDISRVGILRLLLFIVMVFLIAFILFFICALIMRWNSTVGGILMGFIGVYVMFFSGRASGLLYSDI
ncbi:DUF4013 domain-containing protein [uncultured Methanobrevibacter sp.]|uniref:DUF4013 domain-containing protein n=1 Tax=uncultured Methanobrevibacter sp. TaxID=253161 RepID=UPI0025E0501F|nr:DUF4013 domain-containing protein [uncultured Methanobrevibacter sp.]